MNDIDKCVKALQNDIVPVDVIAVCRVLEASSKDYEEMKADHARLYTKYLEVVKNWRDAETAAVSNSNLLHKCRTKLEVFERMHEQLRKELKECR